MVLRKGSTFCLVCIMIIFKRSLLKIASNNFRVQKILYHYGEKIEAQT
jgi:hypothetical protein